VEAPELEQGYSVNQLQTEMKHDLEYYKVIKEIYIKKSLK